MLGRFALICADLSLSGVYLHSLAGQPSKKSRLTDHYPLKSEPMPIAPKPKIAPIIAKMAVMIATATKFGWDVIGFCLPMAFLINQVYVLYFNSKPANISYLSNMYSTGESFKFGMTNLVIIIGVLLLWTQYVMPLMGFQLSLIHI